MSRQEQALAFDDSSALVRQTPTNAAPQTGLPSPVSFPAQAAKLGTSSGMISSSAVDRTPWTRARAAAETRAARAEVPVNARVPDDRATSDGHDDLELMMAEEAAAHVDHGAVSEGSVEELPARVSIPVAIAMNSQLANAAAGYPAFEYSTIRDYVKAMRDVPLEEPIFGLPLLPPGGPLDALFGNAFDPTFMTACIKSDAQIIKEARRHTKGQGIAALRKHAEEARIAQSIVINFGYDTNDRNPAITAFGDALEAAWIEVEGGPSGENIVSIEEVDDGFWAAENGSSEYEAEQAASSARMRPNGKVWSIHTDDGVTNGVDDVDGDDEWKILEGDSDGGDHGGCDLLKAKKEEHDDDEAEKLDGPACMDGQTGADVLMTNHEPIMDDEDEMLEWDNGQGSNADRRAPLIERGEGEDDKMLEVATAEEAEEAEEARQAEENNKQLRWQRRRANLRRRKSLGRAIAT